MIPNRIRLDAFKTMLGGGIGGLAVRATSVDYPFLLEAIYEVVVFTFLLALVTLGFWVGEKLLYPTDDTDDEQPSDLPLFLQ